MKAQTIMKKAPVDWEKTVDRMVGSNRDVLRLELEGICERSGILAAYLDERHGYGCGDQGHDEAVESANKVGRVIHCKAFGYNAYHDISF